MNNKQICARYCMCYLDCTKRNTDRDNCGTYMVLKDRYEKRKGHRWPVKILGQMWGVKRKEEKNND